MARLDTSGRAFVPEEGFVLTSQATCGLLTYPAVPSYRIAHILQQAGDVMGYHYDLGDTWWVDIKVR